MPPRIILSASRRTDIPAFYMDWFMEGIARGFFSVTNPFNRKTATVSAAPEDVHSIVFWSKDFGAFLDGGYGEILGEMGYNLFFLFTVNSRSPVLEPNMAATDTRIRQAEALAARFGARCVVWRFDPVCFFTFNGGDVQDNLAELATIAMRMESAGIRRCITSFADHYPKVIRRVDKIQGLRLIDPPLEEKRRVLRDMAGILASRNISLYTCCEKQLTDSLPESWGIKAGGCISGHLLAGLFGEKPALQRDSGQRKEKGCLCTVSRDIGDYDRHPCFHGCLYCYARPELRSDPNKTTKP